MSKRFYAAPMSNGFRPGRSYTPEEITAARRLNLVTGRNDALTGPLFWATGNYYPNKIKQMAEDARIVSDAITREWPNNYPKEQHS